jgi:DinB family protein
MESYLEQLSKTLEAATMGMSDEALLHAPAGKWCAAEVLEHLRLTYTGTAKMLEKNRELAVVEPAEVSDQVRAARHQIFEQGKFFEGRRSPPFATPKTPPDPGVRTRVQDDLRRLDAAIAEAVQRRGEDANLGNHFALGPLTGKQWCHFHFEHGRHHAKQIDALKAATASH